MTITPQAGDFVLVDIRSDVGKLIHFLQWLNGGKGHYEHVATYDGHGGLYEATPRNGIMHNPLSEYDPKSLFWSTGIIKPTNDQRALILATAKKCIGIDYSFLDYVALAAHHFHLWAPGLKHYIGTTKHMICSQFVDYCYNQAGIQLFTGVWPGYVTPDDLYQLLLTTSGLEFTK
jgi:cell wall-associated NlpC family hydrolase